MTCSQSDAIYGVYCAMQLAHALNTLVYKIEIVDKLCVADLFRYMFTEVNNITQAYDRIGNEEDFLTTTTTSQSTICHCLPWH